MKIITPLGELMYVMVSGVGKLNYDGDGREYTASVKLPKKEAKKFYKEVCEFFEENKPSGFKGNEPVNNIIRKQEDGDYLLSFKTNTEFEDGGHCEVKIKNSKGGIVTLPENTGIGNGSIGRISGTLSEYGNNKKAGVSMFLNAIQISKFLPYVEDDGMEEIDGEFEDFGGADFTEDKPKKKKKKKKNKDKIPF